MNIRRAREDDIPRLTELLLEVLTLHHEGRPDVFKPGRTKYTPEELKETISNDDTPVFVAENDTRVEGYVFCIIKTTSGDNILCDMKTLYIDDLCVSKGTRGKGIGKTLYQYARAYAKEIGCHNLTLNVWECNEGARAFYDRMGLSVQKTLLEDLL